MRLFLVFFYLTFVAGTQCLFSASQVYFSPTGNIQKKIAGNIDSSFDSIDVMCYHFTSRSLAKSLVKAAGRGVKVRILLDKSQSDDKFSMYTFLKQNGINVKCISGIDKGIMHNKVAIFDTKRILTGSYNWTGSAERFNYENAIFSDDENLIFEYSQEFNKLWNDAK